MAVPKIQYRKAEDSDIPGMAKLRSAAYGTEEYWSHRILGYMRGEINPQHARKPRVLYVALNSGTVIGLIAGHLTKRYKCQGELEWIDVDERYRRQGIALDLLLLLSVWFIKQKSSHVCVDVDPSNIAAMSFYKKNGATHLNNHWLVWQDINEVLKKANK